MKKIYWWLTWQEFLPYTRIQILFEYWWNKSKYLRHCIFRSPFDSTNIFFNICLLSKSVNTIYYSILLSISQICTHLDDCILKEPRHPNITHQLIIPIHLQLPLIFNPWRSINTIIFRSSFLYSLHHLNDLIELLCTFNIILFFL